MEPISKTSRGPPRPECVIKDEPHYTAAGASRIINAVSESTLRRWIVRGWSSFGLSLDIERRKGRLLIPELKVLVLREFLGAHRLPGRGSSAKIRAEFRQAVKDAALGEIRARSSYSRARAPRLNPR